MSKEYVKTLFDSSYVHRIEVKMKEGAWEELLETAIDKSWYKVSIKIDGEKFKKVRFRTKGSSSLRNVVAYAFYKDRYSYKLKFNKYDKTRTYYGLDKMLLNNNYKDPTYNYSMEEFENSYQELIDFCMARTKSVRAQLSK